MRKIIVSTLFLVMLSSSLVNAEEVKQKTDEELIAEFMQLAEEEKKVDEELAEAKAKSKALDELEKKVDELSEILQVDK